MRKDERQSIPPMNGEVWALWGASVLFLSVVSTAISAGWVDRYVLLPLARLFSILFVL